MYSSQQPRDYVHLVKAAELSTMNAEERDRVREEGGSRLGRGREGGRKNLQDEQEEDAVV